MYQVLDASGKLSDEATAPPLDTMVTLYEAMVEARVYDRKGMALQRQGRLATYAPFEGQEAAQIGAIAALRDDDWVAGTYRDAALMWAAGYPWASLIAGRTGDERGGSPPPEVNVLPPSITVGGHMIHAVGLAWGERLQGNDRVALASFGDGATSEGDFHEAMNFAAVFDIPVVFFCQNNHYAISLHLSQQTRSESIAAKAAAYGMEGVQVDGNDVLAVIEVTARAVERARDGFGPTLIEAVTYRLGPHTTSDDPSRYRDAAEGAEWAARDPLLRVQEYLRSQGSWDDTYQAQLEQRCAQVVEEAVAAAESLSEPTRDEMLDRMFAKPTSALERQRRGGR